MKLYLTFLRIILCHFLTSSFPLPLTHKKWRQGVKYLNKLLFICIFSFYLSISAWVSGGEHPGLHPPRGQEQVDAQPGATAAHPAADQMQAGHHWSWRSGGCSGSVAWRLKRKWRSSFGTFGWTLQQRSACTFWQPKQRSGRRQWFGESCVYVCQFVPNDLANRWTDIVLLNRVASHRSREGL